MLDISREQIEAIRKDQILGPKIQSGLSEPGLADKPTAQLGDSDWAALYDASFDTLTNEAPVVESFDAEQSKGIHDVVIRGVPGAYFVTAAEFDNGGVFSTTDYFRQSGFERRLDVTHGVPGRLIELRFIDLGHITPNLSEDGMNAACDGEHILLSGRPDLADIEARKDRTRDAFERVRCGQQ